MMLLVYWSGLRDWKVNVGRHIVFVLFFLWFQHSTLFFFLKWLYGFLQFIFYWVIFILWLGPRVINSSWLALYYPGYMYMTLSHVDSGFFFIYFLSNSILLDVFLLRCHDFFNMFIIVAYFFYLIKKKSRY